MITCTCECRLPRYDDPARCLWCGLEIPSEPIDLNPAKEYEEGLKWIPGDNPLGLSQGYYSEDQIEKVVEMSPSKAAEFIRFMRQ